MGKSAAAERPWPPLEPEELELEEELLEEELLEEELLDELDDELLEELLELDDELLEDGVGFGLFPPQAAKPPASSATQPYRPMAEARVQ